MRHPARWLTLSAILAFSLTACSGAASPTPTSSAPTSTAVASSTPSSAPTPPASLPPASATIAFGGGVTGVTPGLQIDCDNPSLGGLDITLFGSTTTAGIATTITITGQGVTVTLDSGAGATFVARTFEGTGVTGFDATKGVHLDGSLTEVTSASKPGPLPAISSITGTVECGDQVPGSSTLTLSGTVPEGAVSGPIDPVRVDCDPNAKPPYVHAIGIIKVGSTPVLTVFQANPSGFSVFVAPTATTPQHFFISNDPSAATLSPTGGHVSGTAAETGTTNTVQVSGDLVCGVVNP
jgi:hypothetical protein